MNKIFILGSNSFSGSNFLNYCLSKNNKIIAISRSQQIKKRYNPYYNIKDNKLLKFFKLDLNNDLEKIIDLIKKIKPEYIVNYASQSMVAESWDFPGDWYRTNVSSTINFLEEIKKMKFLKKYIHFSTPEVYGSTKKSIKESDLFQPSTPYANSRACTDTHLNFLIRQFNFPGIITRAANVYGPYQRGYRIIPKTIYKIIKNSKLDLHGGGNSKRSFIHIDDVSQAVYKIMLNKNSYNSYHISTDEKISIKNLVKLICNKMNYNFNDLVNITSERKGKDLNYFLNSNRLKKEFNWRSKTTLENGIFSTINWMQNYINDFNENDFYYKHIK